MPVRPFAMEESVSVRSPSADFSALASPVDGELTSVRISTDPHLLEDLLECLAFVSFPINPQIYHGQPTSVEFPAYRTYLPEVRDALRTAGFDPDSLEVRGMLQTIAAKA